MLAHSALVSLDNCFIITRLATSSVCANACSGGWRGGEPGGVRVRARLAGHAAGRALGDHFGGALGALPRRAAQRVLPDGLRAHARRLHAARATRAATAPALARRPGGRLADRPRCAPVIRGLCSKC